jgi:hypothetical protein
MARMLRSRYPPGRRYCVSTTRPRTSEFWGRRQFFKPEMGVRGLTTHQGENKGKTEGRGKGRLGFLSHRRRKGSMERERRKKKRKRREEGRGIYTQPRDSEDSE